MEKYKILTFERKDNKDNNSVKFSRIDLKYFNSIQEAESMFNTTIDAYNTSQSKIMIELYERNERIKVDYNNTYNSFILNYY